jgi:uncharacterized RDD family membrane protein YckC
MAAFALDSAGTALIGGVFSGPIFRAEDALGLVNFSSIDTSAEVIAAIILPLWGAAWIYALFEPIVAATPGKLILGLKIARPDGRKAPFATMLARYAAKNAALFIVLPFGFVDNAVAAAAFLVLGLTILGGALWGAGPERRTLHDRISGTAVFRRRDLPPAPTGPQSPPGRGPVIK